MEAKDKICWKSKGKLPSHENLMACLADFGGRRSKRCRDCLITHYTPWVMATAEGIARRMNLRDRDNAVGECLRHLVERIVPRYDGRGRFEPYAKKCIVRFLISLQRKEIHGLLVASCECLWPEGDGPVNDRPSLVPGVNFRNLVEGLPARQAAIVLLAAQGDRPIAEIAAALGISTSTIKKELRAARAEIAKRWAGRIDELLH